MSGNGISDINALNAKKNIGGTMARINENFHNLNFMCFFKPNSCM
jgi:hypothetical protein